MAAYFPGSNIQPETMQTLYLMNPEYAGYAEMANPGNIVLLNQSLGTLTNNTSLASAGQSQHHHHHHPYIGMQFPPAAATASPKHSSAESLESPGAPQHQGVDSTFLANRLGSHGYNTWRNVGNELTFMQGATAAADPNPHTQSLSEKVTGFSTVEHSSVSGLCARATNLKRTPLPNQQLGINQNGMSIQLDQRQQVSEAHVQGLSLSLSPQQLSNMQLSCFQSQSAHPDVNGPSISEASSHENMNMLDRINNNKISGNESSFISSSRDPMQSANLPMWANASQHDKHVYPNAYASSGIQNSITSSKYFKAAQELLDEVVSVGKGAKSDAGKNQKGEKKNAATDGTSNDGAVSASTCIQEVKNENPATLSPADRQELQMKKAKLVAMLDEVDRRYRQYYHQMQIVVSMFEAAAGYGAAKTYTALALKTISRHFRSLRDAIAGQIRLTSKNLGEEDLTGSGHGEGSRLHFVDQQLRQQRALQQLGMLQQHAWRPQRGLPERAVSILRAWLFEHFLHPYPKDADKHYLARQTGLTRNQVSNWFINARVRLWKPMVEEMYMEEIKEAESQASAADSKATAENEQNKKETEPSNPRNPDNAGQDDKTLKGMNGGGGVYLNQTDTPTANLKTNHASLSNGVPPLSMVNLSESTLYHHPHVEDGDDDLRQVQNKKIRNLIHHDSSAILPSTTTMGTPDMGLRAEEHDHEYILGGASSSSSKFATADGKHVGEDYSFASNKIISLDDDTGDFGSYQIDGLSRYGQEPYTHHHHHHHKFGGIGGVSLTLGLQHCDDLSLSAAAAAAQHPYAGNQLPRRSDLGIESSSQFHPHQHIHSTSDVGSAATTPNYDTLNLHNQKRFATHLLHDFVA